MSSVQLIFRGKVQSYNQDVNVLPSVVLTWDEAVTVLLCHASRIVTAGRLADE